MYRYLDLIVGHEVKVESVHLTDLVWVSVSSDSLYFFLLAIASRQERTTNIIEQHTCMHCISIGTVYMYKMHT